MDAALITTIIILAAVIGFLASLFGIGGGFLMMPTMILVLGMDTHITVGTISLVIFFMSLSASIAYGRQRRIDYKFALIIGIASVTGSYYGAYTTSFVPGVMIILMFGLSQVFLSALMGLKKTEHEKSGHLVGGSLEEDEKVEEPMAQDLVEPVIVPSEPSDMKSSPIEEEEEKKWYMFSREWIDKDGVVYKYGCNMLIVMPLSFFAGFLSSLLGIGGGTLYVQIFIFLCGMSIHMAIASSMFVIFLSRISGTIMFMQMGQLDYFVGLIFVIGMIFGAQLGAYVSRRIQSKYLKPMAAMMMGVIAVRMIVLAVVGQ